MPINFGTFFFTLCCTSNLKLGTNQKMANMATNKHSNLKEGLDLKFFDL